MFTVVLLLLLFRYVSVLGSVCNKCVCAVKPCVIHTGFVKLWRSDCSRLLLPHCFVNRVEGERSSRGTSRLLTLAFPVLDRFLHRSLLEEFSEIEDLKHVREQPVIPRVERIAQHAPTSVLFLLYHSHSPIRTTAHIYFLPLLVTCYSYDTVVMIPSRYYNELGWILILTVMATLLILTSNTDEIRTGVTLDSGLSSLYVKWYHWHWRLSPSKRSKHLKKKHYKAHKLWIVTIETITY